MRLAMTALVLALTLSITPGCSALAQLGVDPAIPGIKPKVSVDEVKRAISDEDYPLLTDICTDRVEVQSHSANHRARACDEAIDMAEEREDMAFLQPLCGRRKEDFGRRFEDACPATQRLAGAQGDTRALERLCERDDYDPACDALEVAEAFPDLDAPKCGTLATRVEKAQRGFLHPDKVSATIYGDIVWALAACQEDAVIFERIAHFGVWGGAGYGVSVFGHAHARGPELTESFDRYVASHSGASFLPIEFAHFAANHIGHWLIDTNQRERCAQLTRAISGSSAHAVYGMMGYFVAVGCTQAADHAVPLLQDDDPKTRTEVCHILGKIGSARHLGKVRIIASRDTTHRVIEVRPGVFTKDFYVADACTKAAGMIELRS